MEWVTTSTIIQDLRHNGAAPAWQRLDERFRTPIESFARSLGLSAADAEDVAQNALLAFASALRAGRYDRSRGRLSRWLFGFAYRHAVRQRQRVARHLARFDDAPDMIDSGQFADPRSAITIWSDLWQQSLLDQCISRVRCEFEPRTMQAFELCVRFDRAPHEVAAGLGMPVKAVYNAKHRVLNRIRELCSELEQVSDDEKSPARPRKTHHGGTLT